MIKTSAYMPESDTFGMAIQIQMCRRKGPAGQGHDQLASAGKKQAGIEKSNIFLFFINCTD